MASREVRGKVVVFARPRRVEIRENVEIGKIDDNTVVMRTRYSAISRGTEMDLYHNRMHTVRGETQWYPIISGYEAVGEIIEIGKNVKGMKEGDRISVANLFGGYEEPYCCAWGGQSEYLVINYKSHPQGPGTIVKIPEQVSYEEATFHVLAGTAHHGIERVGLGKDDTVMIIGQGVVGMMAAQIAKAREARVIASDLYESRLNLSKQMRVDEIIYAAREDQVKKVKELTGEKGADVVIESTGKPSLLKAAFEMVKDYGRIHALGWYVEPMVMDIPDLLSIKNLSLSSSAGARPEGRKEFLNMVADERVQVKEMISSVMSIDDAVQAYDLVDKKPNEILKIIFKW